MRQALPYSVCPVGAAVLRWNGTNLTYRLLSGACSTPKNVYRNITHALDNVRVLSVEAQQCGSNTPEDSATRWN